MSTTARDLTEKRPLLGKAPHSRSKYTLIIHGGSGSMSKAKCTPEQYAEYTEGLRAALQAGYAVLRDGGEAMDAAVAAVSYMEDCPLFNSGKGAVFNIAGKNELDASIMLSKPPASHPEIPRSRRGFAMAVLTRTRNPCQLARAIYLAPELVPHTLLSASEPENVGIKLGIETVDPSYFFTEGRWLEHRRGLGLPDTPYPDGQSPSENPFVNLDSLPKGTVGAVALDIRGCIASVTSTGGMTNKMVGRIGDTPYIGAGPWAEEWTETRWFKKLLKKITRKSIHQAVGISCTGDGDYYIRHATASTIMNRMKFLHQSVDKASKVCLEELGKDGAKGGIILLDSNGNFAFNLNCDGMYRGFIRQDGVPKTAIFAGEELS